MREEYKKKKLVVFRVTEEEYSILEENADKAKTTISGYIRKNVVDKVTS